MTMSSLHENDSNLTSETITKARSQKKEWAESQTIFRSKRDNSSRSKVLSILYGSSAGNTARGEIWVSPEVLHSCGFPNSTSGIVYLARDLGADICFLSCNGHQAVPCQAHALRDAVRRVQAEGLACGVVVDGPWGRLSRREGLLSLLSSLRDASYVERDLAEEANLACEECVAWVEAGADLILLADDIAHSAGPYFSPILFAQLLLPRYQHVLATCASLEIPVGFHSDGSLSLLLPDLVTAGFSCLSLEPEAVSLTEFRSHYGSQITLLSGIRAEWLLKRHLPGIESQYPFNELADLIGDGNLILTSACGLSTPESVSALKELYCQVDGMI